MKKLVLSCALLAAGMIGSASFAESAPATCGFQFHVKVKSVLLVSKGIGSGVISCKDTMGGRIHEVPVNIEIKGIGPGLGVFELFGVTGNLGITDIRQIEGDFAVVQANVGVGAAVGASLGFEGQQTGLSFSASVTGGRGAGVMLNGTHWRITLAE